MRALFLLPSLGLHFSVSARPQEGTTIGDLCWKWEEGVWRAYMGTDEETWADVMKYVESNVSTSSR